MNLTGLLQDPMMQMGLGLLSQGNGQLASVAQGAQRFNAQQQYQQRQDLHSQSQQMDIRLKERQLNSQPERRIIKEADGFSYYQDTGERVLPNVNMPEKFEYKSRDIALPDGTYQQQYSNNNGRTWQAIKGSSPYQKKALVENNIGSPKEVFKNERDLRNDFQRLPTTAAFREVQNAYDQISTALSNPSAANDLAAATKFMKILDPGSVVRESELMMAMNATGKMDYFMNTANRIMKGEVLTPNQRVDFRQATNALYEAASQRYNESATYYRGLADDYELNPDRVARAVSVEPSEDGSANGFPRTTRGDKAYEYRDDGWYEVTR